jgi:hypothetical protein
MIQAFDKWGQMSRPASGQAGAAERVTLHQNVIPLNRPGLL